MWAWLEFGGIHVCERDEDGCEARWRRVKWIATSSYRNWESMWNFDKVQDRYSRKEMRRPSFSFSGQRRSREEEGRHLCSPMGFPFELGKVVGSNSKNLKKVHGMRPMHGIWCSFLVSRLGEFATFGSLNLDFCGSELKTPEINSRP